MEIIDKLGIDLKLILAQIVNFLILFFLLTKLLYKPILNLLDKRKKMIEKSVEEGKQIEEKLAKLERDRETILAEASNKAMEILERAKQEGQNERQQALVNAKKDISGLAERYRAQLKVEKEQMYKELKADLAGLIVESCEKVLRKEFTKDDQKRLEDAMKNEISSVKID